MGLKALSVMDTAGPKKVDESTRRTFAFWRRYLKECKPRTVELAEMRPPVLVFTDSAVEEVEGAGTGAILLDMEGGAPRFLAGAITDAVVAAWRAQVGGEQVICQAELLPLVAAQYTWRHLLEDLLRGQ